MVLALVTKYDAEMMSDSDVSQLCSVGPRQNVRVRIFMLQTLRIFQ